MADTVHTTSSRKKDHVDLCVDSDVTYRAKSPGFERVEFMHNALPETDLAEISTGTTFLGKPAALPLMISSMTGGYSEAERINRELAEVCQELSIPMGVGSQRQALESTAYHASFSTVRKAAPTIAITANIGAAEAAQQDVRNRIGLLLDLVEADALTVHLNPLQELLQPEGSTSFRGVLHGIEQLASALRIPIIVKEVGAGISASVARRLLDVGVTVIDVAGAGGTSWAGVELLRNTERDAYDALWDWGIPTVDCLTSIAPLRKNYTFTLIASGGIRSGIEIAKAIGLGANMSAAARVLLQALVHEGQSALRERIETWQRQLRAVMFLTGSSNIEQLQQAELTVRP